MDFIDEFLSGVGLLYKFVEFGHKLVIFGIFVLKASFGHFFEFTDIAEL